MASVQAATRGQAAILARSSREDRYVPAGASDDSIPGQIATDGVLGHELGHQGAYMGTDPACPTLAGRADLASSVADRSPNVT